MKKLIKNNSIYKKYNILNILIAIAFLSYKVRELDIFLYM